MATSHAPFPADPRDFEWCSLSALVVDPSVQRELAGLAGVALIADTFDWCKFEVPTVAPLTGKLRRVVEGQRRITALRRLVPEEQADDVMILVAVLPAGARGPVKEAEAGLVISTSRARHDALAQWRARVTMGQEHEKAAEATLETLGLRLGSSPASRTIAAVDAVRSIVHRGNQTPEEGAELLHGTLAILLAAWPHADATSAEDRFKRPVLLTISRLLYSYPDLDRQRLVDRLQTRATKRWLNDLPLGQGIGLVDALGLAVVAEYNHRLRPDRKITWPIRGRLAGMEVEP